MNIIGSKFNYYDDDDDGNYVEATIIDKFEGIARFNSYGQLERDGIPSSNIIAVTYYKCAIINDNGRPHKLFNIRADNLFSIIF